MFNIVIDVLVNTMPNHKITRRKFIKSIAASGFAFGVPNVIQAANPDHDCIVLGAGMAGLAAAFRLHADGHKNIRVIDSHPGPGGICWTKTEHGFRFPMGTTYIAQAWAGSAARKIYNKLPGKWWKYIPNPFDSFFHDGEILVGATVFHDWKNIPGITQSQKADCRALKNWFLDKYDKIEWPVWDNRKGKLRDYENMTAREMILGFRPNVDAWILGLIDSFMRGVFNGNLDEISGLQAIDMIGDEYDNSPAEGDIVGKTSFVVADLVDELVREIGGDRFILDAKVTEVKKIGGRVYVTYTKDCQSYTITSKYCIIATNAIAAQSIVATMPRRLRNVLNNIDYGEYAVVNLVMDNDTIPINAYDCTLGNNIIDDIYDFTFIQKKSNGIPLNEPPGIYGFYMAALSKEDHTSIQAEDDLIKLCLDQLDIMFGAGTRDKVTSTHVCQYSQGMPIFHPGLTWEQEDILMPVFNQRLILAGDYVQGSPTIEGALESGWYAGTKISENLA